MPHADLLMPRLDAAVAAVQAAGAPGNARVALVLGTGLGDVVERMAVAGALPYERIPHHPASTAPGHAGRLLWGAWAGTPLLVLQGRFHLYEGYAGGDIAFPVRLLARLGVKQLVLTNAAGGLNPAFRAGDLMLIKDHINFLGQNPLTGPNPDAIGPRFPDMAEPYSRALQAQARAVAARLHIDLHEGVYVAVPGPSLETAAETRFLRQAGADAVGMSTVIETIAAVHAGVRVLAFSAISNVNDPDDYQPATLEQIIANAGIAGEKLVRLLEAALPGLAGCP